MNHKHKVGKKAYLVHTLYRHGGAFAGYVDEYTITKQLETPTGYPEYPLYEIEDSNGYNRRVLEENFYTSKKEAYSSLLDEMREHLESLEREKLDLSLIADKLRSNIQAVTKAMEK